MSNDHLYLNYNVYNSVIAREIQKNVVAHSHDAPCRNEGSSLDPVGGAAVWAPVPARSAN